MPTGMADPGVVDFYPDFMGLGRFDFDVFNCKVLSGFPCYCGLASISTMALLTQEWNSAYFTGNRLHIGPDISMT